MTGRGRWRARVPVWRAGRGAGTGGGGRGYRAGVPAAMPGIGAGGDAGTKKPPTFRQGAIVRRGGLDRVR